MFEVISYVDEKNHCPVENYIHALNKKDQDKILEYYRHLEAEGRSIRRPAADYLGGKTGLYELRPGRHRILYFLLGRDKAVLLHAFLKRTDKIPMSEIKIAMKRKDDFLRRT